MSASLDPTPWTAEERFLFHACSVSSPEVRQAALAAVAEEGLDGEWLVTCALKNRVVPLVYRSVHALDGAGLEASSLELLKHYARRHQASALIHVQELFRLLDLLEKRGVCAMPYKGPVLAATLYEDLSLRQYYDLDVLVRPEDVSVARGAIEELGFVAHETFGEGDEEHHLHDDCELHFHHPERDLLLELHWEALPRRHRAGFAVQDVWDRLVPLEIASRPVQGFGPEDLFLVLCIHGGEKHRWNRLQMLTDIARLCVCHPDLNWELLLQRAGELQREQTVLLGAFCAWALLGAPLPDAIVARVVGDPRLYAEAAATVGRVLRVDSGLIGYRPWSRNVRELERLTGRSKADRPARTRSAGGLFRYLGVVLRPEWTDKQALALPEALSFLYWGYRPLRLIRRHGMALFSRV